jgi:insecticidal toxin complex protein TccC
MRRPSMLAAILVGLAVLTAASSASAMCHPTVGRWLERDPSGESDGVNLYQFVRDNPISRSDPTGLATLPYGCGCFRPRTIPGTSASVIIPWIPRVDIDVAIIGGECTCTGGPGVPPSVIAAGMAITLFISCEDTCFYILDLGPRATPAHRDAKMQASVQSFLRGWAGYLRAAACISCTCGP